MQKNIKMAANCVIALDGVHPVSLKKGEVRLVDAGIADALLGDGRATEVDKDGSYENKDAGSGTTAKKATKKAKKKK